MAAENAHMNTIRMKTDGCEGEVRIADDVVTTIIGLAASDVKGVSSLAGNATRDVISRVGTKSLSKGVRLTIDGDEVNVSLAVNIRYGYNVPDTCAKVQDRVKSAVETMTGLKVNEVNIRVASVVMDQAQADAAKE